MSENIELKKEVKIEFSIDLVECDECGEELPFSVSQDNWGDLTISVGVCKSCGGES